MTGFFRRIESLASTDYLLPVFIRSYEHILPLPNGRIDRRPRASPQINLDYILSDPPEKNTKIPWLGLLPHRRILAFVVGRFLPDAVWRFHLFWAPSPAFAGLVCLLEPGLCKALGSVSRLMNTGRIPGSPPGSAAGWTAATRC
jgi:hypothetical protein